MSRVLVLRKPYCGMRSKRVEVHFFRQISVSTTLLKRDRVYASRRWLGESTELAYEAELGLNTWGRRHKIIMTLSEVGTRWSKPILINVGVKQKLQIVSWTCKYWFHFILTGCTKSFPHNEMEFPPLRSARNYSTLWFLVVQFVVSRVWIKYCPT